MNNDNLSDIFKDVKKQMDLYESLKNGDYIQEYKPDSPTMADNVANIARNSYKANYTLSDISQNVDSINKAVLELQTELEAEKVRAKKAENSNKWFSVLMAVFSVVIGIGLPMLIDWIKTLLQA